jgi:hypothetical protein
MLMTEYLVQPRKFNQVNRFLPVRTLIVVPEFLFTEEGSGE